jgi:threonine/homoserine/homoserine lactone efflux protein
MDPTFFTRGFVIGLTVAMAIGPMSVLTMRRTIAHGRLYGLVSGLGIATADATYGAVAAFGLTAVTAALVGARTALGLVGGVFLVWLAIRTLRVRPAATTTTTATATATEDRPGLPGGYLSTYGLTMTNPTTILSFAAIFAGFGLAGGGLLDAVVLTVGVFLGSSLWWVILTSAVGLFRTWLTPVVLVWINRVSGAVLLGFGVLAIGLAAGALR